MGLGQLEFMLVISSMSPTIISHYILTVADINSKLEKQPDSHLSLYILRVIIHAYMPNVLKFFLETVFSHADGNQ